MNGALTDYLDTLKADTVRASAAEDAFQRDVVVRRKALEQERAFAFRRLNLMRAVADAMASAEAEEIAVAGAAVVLRSRLGWDDNSDARDEVVSRFVPVAQAMFSQLAPGEAEQDGKDIGAALAKFEAWYAGSHPVPFWVLFENVMPETPRVDF